MISQIHPLRLATIYTLLSGTLLTGIASASTIVYYRFEEGALTADSGPNNLTLSPRGTGSGPLLHVRPTEGPGSKFPSPIPQNGLNNGSSIIGNGANGLFSGYYIRENHSSFNIDSGMTIEAFINLSNPISSGVGYIAAHSENSGNNSAWALSVSSVTGTLRFGFTADAWAAGQVESLDSGIMITPGHDYYVGFSIVLSDTSENGAIFYVKNLTTGTDLQVVGVTHSTTSMNAATVPLSIGGSRYGGSPWSGLIDEVRWSNVALNPNELLISVPEPSVAALMLGAGAIGLIAVRNIRRRRQGKQ